MESLDYDRFWKTITKTVIIQTILINFWKQDVSKSL